MPRPPDPLRECLSGGTCPVCNAMPNKCAIEWCQNTAMPSDDLCSACHTEIFIEGMSEEECRVCAFCGEKAGFGESFCSPACRVKWDTWMDLKREVES